MRRRDARWAAGFVLAAWACGLAVATARLEAWQAALVPVLAQMQADTLVRNGARGDTNALAPQWYQRRALALLSAVERLHDDSAWTLVMPGSWRTFDDVEERAMQRVEGAFGLMVVRTIERALELRASALTGVALRADGAALDLSAPCHTPAPAAGAPADPASLAISAMPEHTAMAQFLDEAQRLDDAMRSLDDLRQNAPARAADLQRLVRYSLGATLQGPAWHSLALFKATSQASDPSLDALRARLQACLACAAVRGMSALHERLVTRNPLVLGQQRLATLLRLGLFDAHADESDLPRARMALHILNETHALLESTAHPWMHDPQADFGQAHRDLIERIASIKLLGPQVAQQVAHEAHTQRRQLLQRWRSGAQPPETALEWEAISQRFVPAPERESLHLGLDALVRESAALHDVPALPASLPALASLIERRQRLRREVVLLLPASLRPAAALWVDRRIGALALSQARQLVSGVDLETALLQLGQVQSTLDSAGAPALASGIGQRILEETFSALAPSPTPHSDAEDAGEAPASGAD